MADLESATLRAVDAAEPRVADDLKKRARRRLVGAAALAVLAVIVLPMVMDQEPKPAGQDIQIRIPNQDSGSFTSRILPAKPAATPLPPVEPQAAPPAAPTPPAAASRPETPGEANPPPVPTKPAAEPTAKADKPGTVVEPATNPVDDPRAKSILDGDAAQWIVQLGAFRDPPNVRLLQAKIKELGYASYTEKVATSQGPRIRVRAGPFASRDAAEKARSRLKKIGAGGGSGGTVAQK